MNVSQKENTTTATSLDQKNASAIYLVLVVDKIMKRKMIDNLDCKLLPCQARRATDCLHTNPEWTAKGLRLRIGRHIGELRKLAGTSISEQ